MPAEITNPARSYSMEVIPDAWGGYRYRFIEDHTGEERCTITSILVSDHGDKRTGVTAHMLVRTKTPGDSKYCFRVDDPIPVTVARHIIGLWISITDHPEPVPFPVKERNL